MIKRAILLPLACLPFIAYFLFSATCHAVEGGAEVFLRSGKHDEIYRIVFEASDEAFIRNTVVASSQNRIRVIFPSQVDIKVQGKLELEGSLKEKTYVISMSAPFKIKTLRLSAPPRLSIDITPQPREDSKPADIQAGGAPAIPNIRIVLDPGHGGYDLGILAGEFREKDVTMSIARAMESFLIKKSRTVFLTRKADQFVSITDRAVAANQKFPDVFVSLHFSSTDSFAVYTAQLEPAGSDAAGELYALASRQRRYAEKSSSLAESIAKAIREDFKKDVAFRKMALPLLSSVGAPSVMVEIPRNIVFDASARGRLSDTILKGIALYANQ